MNISQAYAGITALSICLRTIDLYTIRLYKYTNKLKATEILTF